MDQDKLRTLKLLEAIEDDSNEFNPMLKSFNEFEWNFEKHIFVEERAIFASGNPTNIIVRYPIITEASP